MAARTVANSSQIMAVSRASARARSFPCALALARRSRGHRTRIEDRADPVLAQQFVLAHELDDALAGAHRLGRELGRLLVADVRIERGHHADAALDEGLARF